MSEQQPLVDRSNRRLVPDWLEEAAALAGREMFALSVSARTGKEATPEDLDAARSLWDNVSDDSRIGRTKPGFIDQGRTVIIASAGPFLDQIQQRDHEITELRAGRGHYPGSST